MKSLSIVILFVAMQFRHANGDCGLNAYDTPPYFDSYAWLPDYPIGTVPRHPLMNKLSDAYVMNMSAPILYPGRFPFFIDLNDTIEVGVRFVNADTIPLVIMNTDVESWIVPLVYEIGDKIETSLSLAGPPSVKWRVRYWRMPNGDHVRPDTLFYKKDYIMKLDVWDVPEGKYQLAIMGTNSVPEWFDVMPSSDFYHMLPAQSLADSINAWATICERLIADEELAKAEAWVDTIFTYNTKSTVGFYEQAELNWQNDDSAGTVDAFDQVLERLANWDDPALPDTTDMAYDGMNLKWKHFMIESVTQSREMYINCPEWR